MLFFRFLATTINELLICFSGEELECWFCLSDDHNLGDCNAEHAGGIVTCSDNPEAKHYGDKCAVGHTG